MTLRHSVAVDLGASSGRVMLARFDSDTRSICLREIHRFTNCLKLAEASTVWDVDALEDEIRTGLQKACDIRPRRAKSIAKHLVDYAVAESKWR